jgi:hypothetical protein
MEERQVIFFPYFFFTYFFPVLFFPVLFSRTFSKVETFEIQRFKISVSCFSNTCNYNTVHVPCGIATETSLVGVPLDGWGARMGDLKGPKINLFNLKEDWNVLYHQPIISLEIEPIRTRYFRPISQSDSKNWTNQKRSDLFYVPVRTIYTVTESSLAFCLFDRQCPFTGYLPLPRHFIFIIRVL